MGSRSRAGTWAKALVRALGPGVGQGAGIDAAICGVARLGGDRIDLGLLCLVALPWESGRARARVRVRVRARRRGAGVSAEVRGGGRRADLG